MSQAQYVLAAALALLATGVSTAASATREPAKRELTTDRPDATESPFTVEPGHVQLEMDFANYTRTKVAGTRFTETEWAPFNLRFGVASDLEVGFFMVPFRRETESPPVGPGSRLKGFGDVTLRTKLNLLGNDGGRTALGAIADLKLPTGSGGLGNGKFEGALTIPVAFELSGGWGGGAMTSFGMVYDGTSYQLAWGNTLTFSRELMPDVGGFLELTTETGVGSAVTIFNCGVTRAFGRDLQFDAGINVGVSRSAPDFGVFAGLARRF
jgi:hypothetical protein